MELTPDEEATMKVFMERIPKICNLSEDVKVPTWNTGLKFCMARKFDVNRAIHLYINHELTRKKENLNDIDPVDHKIRQHLDSDKFTIIKAKTNPHTVAIYRLRYQDGGNSNDTETKNDVLKALLFQFDSALLDPTVQRQGIIFVYDMTNAKFSQFDLGQAQRILTLLRGAYPIRLRQILVINSPFWFRGILSLITYLIPQKIVSRITFAYTTTTTPNNVAHENKIPKSDNKILQAILDAELTHDHRGWILQCLKGHFSESNFNKNQEDCKNQLSGQNGDICQEKNKNAKIKIPTKYNKEFTNFTYFSPQDDSLLASKLGNSKISGLECFMRKLGANFCQENSFNFDSHFNANVMLKSEWKTITNIVSNQISSEFELFKGEFEWSMDMLKNSKNDFNSLFNDYSFKTCQKLENLCKNRYTDVPCFEYNRVILSKNNPNDDYINANWVHGFQQEQTYICTQGPLSCTINDFWHMCWQYDVTTIIMLTKCKERGKVKCEKYWPSELNTDYNSYPYKISHIENVQYPNFIFTHLELTNLQQQNEKKHIKHYYYKAWPDFGIPHSVNAFLDFWTHINFPDLYFISETAKINNLSYVNYERPIVVHCSAGIGRTGTYLALDIGLRQILSTKQTPCNVNINATLKNEYSESQCDIPFILASLRKQRYGAIQTPSQYCFIYACILYAWFTAFRHNILPHKTNDNVHTKKTSKFPTLDRRDLEKVNSFINQLLSEDDY